ncbi:thioesterase II family protein [Micromonospora sp. WMMD723]|uniref:thioesterase II family protein n=1 Tax=unclassified Micromonospora TaxID=2617518 RepID=UPI003B925344
MMLLRLHRLLRRPEGSSPPLPGVPSRSVRCTPGGHVPQPRSPWIRTLTPASATPNQLICLPHSGGTASYYTPMAHLLADDIETLAIQYPGRQDRYGERAMDSVYELADHVTEALLPQMGRPTSLFGHSMGAAVAFEVAVRLEARGHRLVALFVSGRAAPDSPLDRNFHAVDDDQLVQELVRLGGTDPAIVANSELIELILPTIRADYRASETYRHRGDVVHCPLIALSGTADPYVPPGAGASWHGYTAGPFRLYELPGGHFFLDEHRDRVQEIIREHAGHPRHQHGEAAARARIP